MTLSLLYSFFCTVPAPPEIYTLSLHDALPIWDGGAPAPGRLLREPARALGVRLRARAGAAGLCRARHRNTDRKSTRLNSSHTVISYAVFCLKKKKKNVTTTPCTPPCTTFHSTY